MIVSVEGLIGSGKSTTARMLADRLSYPAVLEKTDVHPFLADFYADPARSALQTELAFVLLHYHQLRPLARETNLVADFSPGKDLVFARMNLSGEDLSIFEDLFEKLIGRLTPPALAVFLDLPIELLMRRIAQRGRPYELGIAVKYLERLKGFYRQNMSALATEVVIVRVSESDTRAAVAERVVQVVESKSRSRTHEPGNDNPAK